MRIYELSLLSGGMLVITGSAVILIYIRKNCREMKLRDNCVYVGFLRCRVSTKMLFRAYPVTVNHDTSLSPHTRNCKRRLLYEHALKIIASALRRALISCLFAWATSQILESLCFLSIVGTTIVVVSWKWNHSRIKTSDGEPHSSM